MAKEKINEAIGRLRRVKSMEQKELAGIVGVRQSSWSRHETGKGEMSLNQALRALKALGCSVQVIDENGELVWEG